MALKLVEFQERFIVVFFLITIQFKKTGSIDETFILLEIYKKEIQLEFQLNSKIVYIPKCIHKGLTQRQSCISHTQAKI